MKEQKAKLLILDAQGNQQGNPIDVQYNPDKYSKSWNLTWQKSGETLQWTETTPADFAITLHYDGYEKKQDVTQMTVSIRALIDPTSGQRPVGCLFQWGKVVYKGVVKNFKEDYTLFLPDGTPVRSEVTVTLQPWPGDLQNG